MGPRLCLLLLSLTAACRPQSTPRDDDSTAILRQADRARGNIDGVEWEVHLDARETGRIQTMSLCVWTRGYDVLARTLTPPKRKGNCLLIRSGNMWFHRPGLSKPAPISKRQRLLGNAANGDIASTNYAEDYTPIRLESQTIDGEQCYVFDLNAASKRTTYSRIKYWISQQRMVGVRAEYYTVSGKHFKTATMAYAHRARVNGGEAVPFISEMKITDELVADAVTTLTFSAPRIREIPRHVFDVNRLPEFR